MPIVKIPSENVYSIENAEALIKNKISKCSATLKNVVRQYGEISNVSIKLLSIEENNSSTKINYIGNDTSVNTVPFALDGSAAENIDELGQPIPLLFNLDNVADIRTNIDGIVTNLGYIIKQICYNTSTEEYIERVKFNSFLTPVSTPFSFEPKKNPNVLTWVGIHSIDTGIIDIDKELFEEIVVVEENITVFGTYITSTDNIFNYQSSTNNVRVFQLPTNELSQSQNSYRGQKSSYYEYLSKKVISQYKNGKEVIRLKCSVGDYYDAENGSLVISTTSENIPMTFKKYDIVEPYIFTSEGEVPFAIDKNDLPQKYQVLGVDFDYSGVVWQTLTLQSYTE
jgi:hypothetical protein